MSNDILIGIGSRNGTEPEVKTLSGTDLTVNLGTWFDSYKYVIHHTNNRVLMYRYGDLWRDETGDSAIKLAGKGITRVHGAMITDADFKQFMQ